MYIFVVTFTFNFFGLDLIGFTRGLYFLFLYYPDLLFSQG